MADRGFFGSLPFRPAGLPQQALTAPPAHEPLQEWSELQTATADIQATFTSEPACEPLQDWSELQTATAEIPRRGPNGETKDSTAHSGYPFLSSFELYLDLEGTKIPARLRHIKDRLYGRCYFDWNDIMTTKRIVDEIEADRFYVSALLQTPLFVHDRVSMGTAEISHSWLGYHENLVLHPGGFPRQPLGYLVYGSGLWQEGTDSSQCNSELLIGLKSVPYFMIDLPTCFSMNFDGSANWMGTKNDTLGFARWSPGEEESIYIGSYSVNALKYLVMNDVPEDRRRQYNLEDEIVSFTAILHHKTLDIFMHWCEDESGQFYMSYLDSFFLPKVDDIERCGRVMRNMVQAARELHWKMTAP